MNITLSVTPSVGLSRKRSIYCLSLPAPLSAQFYGMKSGHGDFCFASFASCSIPAPSVPRLMPDPLLPIRQSVGSRESAALMILPKPTSAGEGRGGREGTDGRTRTNEAISWSVRPSEKDVRPNDSRTDRRSPMNFNLGHSATCFAPSHFCRCCCPQPR